jgi:hypothetical protein
MQHQLEAVGEQHDVAREGLKNQNFRFRILTRIFIKICGKIACGSLNNVVLFVVTIVITSIFKILRENCMRQLKQCGFICCNNCNYIFRQVPLQA